MSKKNETLSNDNKSTAEQKENPNLLFSSINYKLMILSLAVILIGYIVMIGGNNDTPGGKFPYEEIYSAQRIIISPIIILSGFGIAIYAILKSKK